MASPERQAAELLWRHCLAGTVLDALPAPLRPANAAQGHAIQAEWPAVAGQRVVGWKIAATSLAGQAHINVGGPLAGRVLEGWVFEAGATVSLAGVRMRVAEPEFAFRFGRDVSPRARPHTVDEVLAAVASLHPALELPDSRMADFARAGEAQLIADVACCGRFTLGAAAPEAWRGIDLSTHRVHGRVVGADGEQTLAREGSGRAVLDDPRIALAWLVNELSGLGITLCADQWVSTGTCMAPLAIAPGDSVRADFGVLGQVAVTLVD